MDDDDFDAMDAEEMAIFADDMADLRAAEKRIAELEGERDKLLSVLDGTNKANRRIRSERDSLLAENVALLEAHDQIGIGGNHLASALIHILGAGNDTFPPYQTDYSAAQEIIGDPIKFDLWWCWAVIMRQRDALANQATTEAMERVRNLAKAEGIEEAAQHCVESEVLMPAPEPGTTLRQHGANVAIALAVELWKKAAELGGGK